MTAHKIRLSKCSVGNAEVLASERALRSEYLGMGVEVKHFEDEIKDYLDSSFEVVCVSSGTSALVLALSSLGVRPGDEVLIPTVTYVASFQAVSGLGATPVACDVCLKTGFIDVVDARSKVTKRTRAIMPVHYASSSSGMQKVYDLASEYGLRVVEDAAQAFGCKSEGKFVGSFGDIICFSFDGIKNITCGEGGAILTADKNLAERVRNARLLGVDKDSERRFSGSRSWDFDVQYQGFRAHMSNINAAIGRSQLLRFEKFSVTRQKLAKTYISLLEKNTNITLFDFDYNEICPHIFPVRVKSSKRDFVIKALAAEGIEYGFHYKPNHLLSYFRSEKLILPNSELMWSEILTLPLHFDLSEVDIRRVCEVVNCALEYS